MYYNQTLVKLFALVVTAIFASSCNRIVVRYAGESDLIQASLPAPGKVCKESENYIIDTNHLNATPIRYVRVNFHIMQESDGSGSWNEAEGRKFVHDIVEQSNNRWNDNQPMTLPLGNSTPDLPIPIRIVLQRDPITGEEGIYFHRDDTLCYWNRSATKGPNSLSDRTVISKYQVGIDSIINIFLIEHDPDSIGSPTYGEPKMSGISFINSIKLFSMYYQGHIVKYTNAGVPFTHDAFYFSKLLNHELGHCFNLNHTWNWDDSCDDTPKNSGCWSVTGVPPCDTPNSNNMMDYNISQQAVTPCQIGRMEYNFTKETGGARQFAIPFWCEYHAFERVVVYRNENLEWNGAKDLWGDIEIREGATLTIRCTVSLPEQAKVIIKPGGTLIIDGGTLTNRCGDKFEGVEIWENKKTDQIGKVMISNGGKLENMVNYTTITTTE